MYMDKIEKLKETYLKRTRVCNELISSEKDENNKKQLKVELTCYKHFIIALEQ